MEPLTAADPRTVADFRLRARLGAGGMGRVYLATSPAGRIVAVKVIQPELASDQEFSHRFRAEVDSARLVSGMYTAPVVGAGVNDVPPWLATAFVPGPPLDEVVSRLGPLPVAALWRLAAGLAEALRAIHSVGVVHRDLKPANVLLAADGPRVIDFGISRAITRGRLTTTGSVIGTLGYMSPEQVQGHPVGPASDVFSLGCVLVFAAAGSSPFVPDTSKSPVSALYRVVHVDPELDEVPAEIRELIRVCLAKDPARRPEPGQVAAQCAMAADHLGLSPATFWPAVVADDIQSHQAALMAQLQAFQVPAAPAAVALPAEAPPANANADAKTLYPATAPAVSPPSGTPAAPAPAWFGGATATRAPGRPPAPGGPGWRAPEPAAPGGPGTPDDGGSPGAADLPGDDDWEIPEYKSAPLFRRGHGSPDEFGSPDQPGSPHQPGSPEQPGFPDQASFPDGPRSPHWPGSLDEPGSPGDPSRRPSPPRLYLVPEAARQAPAPVQPFPAPPAQQSPAPAQQSPAPASAHQPARAPVPPSPVSAPRTIPAPRLMSRRGFLIGGGVAGAAALGGGTAWALSSNSSPAPQPGPESTKRTGSLAGPPGTLAWTFQASQAVNANPTAANGVVYFGSAGSRLYAVNAATGRKVWALPVNSATAAPTVTDGIVCVSATQGNFYAVRATSGTLAWEVNGVKLAAYRRNWAAVGTDVAVALGDGSVRMYGAGGGRNLWIVTTADAGGYGQTVAAAGSVAAGGVVYALDALGVLHAIGAAAGREVYSVQLLRAGDTPATDLVVSGTTLYVGARSGPLYAVDRTTGTLKWTFQPVTGSPDSAPVIAAGVVYFNDSSGALHAVNAATGKLKWTHRDGGTATTSPAVAGGNVYIASGKTLRQLNAKTGKAGWTFTPSGTAAFVSTPAVAAGRVFIGASNHKLYAIHA